MNFFQPSFKLAEKTRDGAKVRKRYHPPATPYQRLMADPRTSEDVRHRVEALRATLDPVRLLQQIRAAQQHWSRSPTGRCSAKRPDRQHRLWSSSCQVCERRGRRARCARPASRSRSPSARGAGPTRSWQSRPGSGMVRGRALADIARTVRAAAARASRGLSGRAATNAAASPQGVAPRSRTPEWYSEPRRSTLPTRTAIRRCPAVA